MPAYQVTSPDGKTFEVTAPEGATQDQVLKYAQSQWAAQPVEAPAAVQAGNALNQIPRQLGLTARYAMEGPAQAAELFTEPLRKYVTDPIARNFMKPGVSDLVKGTTKREGTPLGQMASQLADRFGLPKPEGANERVVGDATRLVAGAGALGSVGRAASSLPGMAGKVGQFFSANPTTQLTSAAGAGLASGASREAGASPLMQAGAGLIGGLAAPSVLSAGTSAVRAVGNRLRPMQTQQVDNRISLTLQRAGFDWAGVDERTKQAVRADVSRALALGDDLDAGALQRLVDFRTVGATPTRATVTLDPVQITREKNLAKVGANSMDVGLQSLARIENQNNRRLIERMNEAGANRGDALAAGEQLSSTVLGRQSTLRGAEQAAWDAAKGSPGYRQPVSSRVISDINRALGEEGQMAFMDPRISRYMEAFQQGQQPFTPQDYRNLQSMLSKAVSAGGNEGAAARTAQRILMDSDIQPITNPRGLDLGNAVITEDMAARVRGLDAAPGESIDAVNQARRATRQAYAYEESTPIVRSVLSEGAGSDPARLAQRFVVGGTPREAQMLAQEVGPEGLPIMRSAILAHLKEKALGGAADETGNFSQSAYNRALSQIGDRKLSVFFSPEELAGLRATGRVAAYTQFQPRGSAVNNSNSGALALGAGLDFLSRIAPRIPVVNDTITGILNGTMQRQAANVAPSLLNSPGSSFSDRLAPAALYGGLLSAQPVNQR